MTNSCGKERQAAKKHAQSKSDALESVVKHPKTKKGAESEAEVEHGPDGTLEAPDQGFEDEYTQDEPDFDELDELLLDPDADKEASPGPLDSASEPWGDSTGKPEKLPELDLTYLMPKAGGTVTTPCVLSTSSSFMKFQRSLTKCFGVDDLDNTDVMYKLNTKPVKDSPMCLDTLEEYRHMLSEVCKLLTGTGKGKKSPVLIKIFCKKRESTPDPVPTKAKAKKNSLANNKDSVDDDDDSGTMPNWKILKTLRKDFACNVKGHSLCFNLPGGVHHYLTPSDLSLWALTI
ncbi:hypothetical protein FRC10_004209, partial [Ceratobasidium sp. 414]